ncbi:MAG TPA: hypothetical protein IAA21_01950 [Candidatus Blautia faecigallinarum]|uniref:Uncharacterized protein n=1 Tax=Candidatus Blautia faecigallinarum TaxID=2838488 RepID=A0A9D2DR61_9FIRM|nr:hypothetical protein [Candidatus Blautia faecigallinarum]
MNRERNSGRITYRKAVRLMAAAALTAALVCGQSPAVFAESQVSEETQISILPENITIEEPVPLYEVSLPDSEYGTLSWADDSCVPNERVQSYEVILTPYEEVDLSGEEGYDQESGVLIGYVTVVVSSLEEEAYEEELEEDPEEEADPTTVPDPSVSPDPSVTPEASGTPEETPELTEAPGEDETKEEPEQEKPAEDVPEEEAPGEAQVGGQEPAQTEPVPEITKAPVENIFDQPEEILEEDNRLATAEDNLSIEEQKARAAENHSCSGISVSGISLPWYVQFRVSSGEDYEFTNEADASIFKSYEFQLWDLKTDTEYQIPDGEYISVTVPVKEGYKYTIEHLLENGAIETIIPSVEGSTMVFSTHSFSPFGIAGSKPVIGSDIAEEGYGNDNGDQNGSDGTTSQVPVSPAGSSDTASSSGANQATAPTANPVQTSGNTQANTQKTVQQNNGTASGAVATGDPTVILPFVVMAAGSAGAIIKTTSKFKKRK